MLRCSSRIPSRSSFSMSIAMCARWPNTGAMAGSAALLKLASSAVSSDVRARRQNLPASNSPSSITGVRPVKIAAVTRARRTTVQGSPAVASQARPCKSCGSTGGGQASCSSAWALNCSRRHVARFIISLLVHLRRALCAVYRPCAPRPRRSDLSLCRHRGRLAGQHYLDRLASLGDGVAHRQVLGDGLQELSVFGAKHVIAVRGHFLVFPGAPGGFVSRHG